MNLHLLSKCVMPMKAGYHLSDDMLAELDKNGFQYYQELIGVLQWVIELDRTDIFLGSVIIIVSPCITLDMSLTASISRIQIFQRIPTANIVF